MDTHPRHWVVRIGRTVAGFVLIGAGIAMLALPGPGWLTIALGLGLLAGEFRWARRFLARMRKVASKVIPRRYMRRQRQTQNPKGHTQN